jgi:hypothetical protein
MLTLPVFRALPCAARAVLAARAFAVRGTLPVVPPKPRLLDPFRAALSARHYSGRIEGACVAWVKRLHLLPGPAPPG